MKLEFNSLEYITNEKIKQLYKKRLEYSKVKEEIKELNYFIIDSIINNDIFINCNYDVSLSIIEGNIVKLDILPKKGVSND